MRRCLYRASLILGLLLVTHAARADTFSFLTDPNPGNVSGIAGSTVGWGYSITNNSASNSLVLTGIDSDLFLAADGLPDASPFLFPILAPLQTLTQQYDPLNGLFQFTWNPGVPVGTTETGSFTVFAQFCDNATPSNCVDAVPESAAYTATVISNFPAAVPEPSSFLLLVSGLCGIGLCTRHRQSAATRSPGRIKGKSVGQTLVIALSVIMGDEGICCK
jgi:hypothetical protein